MKLVRQKHSLQIPILKSTDSVCQSKGRHGPLLPENIRGVICGPSNCGKTCVALGLLLHPLGLRYKNVYIFSNSIFQPKYQKLKNVIAGIPEMTFHGSQNVLLPVDQIKPYSVVIFDDFQHNSQTEIQRYFSMGRHFQVDVFFICQTYSYITKQLLRDNLNLVVLFEMDPLNLKHVFSDHVASSDISFTEFTNMCKKCWQRPYGFMVINKDSPNDQGRYRFGFDEFFIKQ